MLKKTITYTDYNGIQRSEDYYFHLTRSEIVELEMSKRYGLSDAIERATRKAEGKDVVDAIKMIILQSVGEKTSDGRRFIKNAQIREEFEQSPAYDQLFMEMVTDAAATADFIRSVYPHVNDVEEVKAELVTQKMEDA